LPGADVIRKKSGTMYYAASGVTVAQTRRTRRRLSLMLWLAMGSSAMVAVYSAIFLLLMHREGQTHTWASALYWTITTISTLGYGDVTFASSAGRLFSIVVRASAILRILIVCPFMFISIVLSPWMEERG